MSVSAGGIGLILLKRMIEFLTTIPGQDYSLMNRLFVLGMICMLLAGCSTGTGVVFDSSKAHHGDGEFISQKKHRFLAIFSCACVKTIRCRLIPMEIKSIVGVADRELIGSYAIQPRVTWIGHATALVQYQNISYLTDPHLTQYPFYYEVFVEPRYTQPALSFEQMPKVDFVVISHNHFDSLDHRTVDMFGDSVTWYVPLGLKAWFLDRGISAGRVIELDWWDSHRFNDQVEVTMTPAQHWSKRTPWDNNQSLWGGWAVDIAGFKSWFAGDTGYNKQYFKDIGANAWDLSVWR